ncbi:MAG: hypothetical protein BWX80_03487 [Candidatus Hydrogenedentes bacterium ADurb.Bin101]|nr:MAG: hypothetical protein BWX80_03487 [Candidatus Hydrogenedentes bacterium ADurb.Bin101]
MIASHTGDFAALGYNFLRGHQCLDDDAFVFGLFNFFLVGGHLVARAAVQDGYRFRAQAHGCTRGVNGRIAAADDDHFLPDRRRPAQIIFAQEFDGIIDALRVLIGDAQFRARRGADGEKYRFVSFITQLLQCEIFAKRLVRFNFDAHALNHADFTGQLLARHAVGGNALHQHASGTGRRFKDLGLITEAGQEIRAGQAGRAAADDSHLALGISLVFAHFRKLYGHFLFDHKALDAPNRDGIIEIGAAAFVFTGVEAYPRANGRKGVAVAMHTQRFGVAFFGHQRYESRNIHIGRAGAHTGGAHEGRADARRTPLLADMNIVFFTEMADGGKDRIWRRLTQAAQGGILDLLAEGDQFLHIAFLAFALADAGHDLEHALGADAAGHALAAGFILHEVQEEPGHIHHARVFIHDDEAAGTHNRAQLGKRFVIHRHVEVFAGDAAA